MSGITGRRTSLTEINKTKHDGECIWIWERQKHRGKGERYVCWEQIEEGVRWWVSSLALPWLFIPFLCSIYSKWQPMCCLRLELFWGIASGYRLYFLHADRAIFEAIVYIQHSWSRACALGLSGKNSVVNIFTQYDVLDWTTLLQNLTFISFHVSFVVNTTSGVMWLYSVSSFHGTPSLWLLHISDVFVLSLRCVCAFSQCALPSFASNYWTNCWFVGSSYFDPKYLFSVAHLSLMIMYSQFFQSLFPHIVPPSTNMFPQ